MMKKNNSLFKAFAFIAVFLISGITYGQSCCAKKANCPLKGTADCPLIKASTENATSQLENCPLKGTPDCPLVKNCPLKGTPDCPYASVKTEATSANVKEENLPACCKKRSKEKINN